MRIRNASTLVLSSALLSQALLAQGTANPSDPEYVNQDTFRGQMSAMTVGVSLSTPLGTPDRVLAKAEGDQTSFPLSWGPTSPIRPINYDPEELFPGDVHRVSIDAWSTGNDFVPDIDLSGKMQVSQSNRWVALTVSFTDDTPGVGGSYPDLVAQREARHANDPTYREEPGADLYSYYFPGSSGIAPRLVGKTLVEQSSEHMGFGIPDEIDAMDFGMGVFSYRGVATPAGPYNHRDFLYFSITKDSANALNSFYSSGNAPAPQFAFTDVTHSTYVASMDPAAIYVMEWNPDPTVRTWDRPYVYRSSADLIKEPNSHTYDVDAIAVDSATHGDKNIIFSTTLTGQAGMPMPSQLMVSQEISPTTYATTILKDENGGVVAEKIGSGDETRDVDATCISDPEALELGTHFGTNFAHLELPLPLVRETMPLGFSLTRVGPAFPTTAGWGSSTPGDETLYMHATGRTYPGDPGGMIVFYWAIDVNGNLPLSSFETFSNAWTPFHSEPWNPTGPNLLKDPSKGATFPVPNNNPIFYGYTMFFCAGYLENGTGKIFTTFVSAVEV